MNFLKSTIASAISQGPIFGYSSDERVDFDTSIWSLHNGTKRGDGTNCSVFKFDIAQNRDCLPLALNALRKWKTLRHPGVAKLLDSLETDSHIYIATERLTPLEWHLKRKSLGPETIKWGLSSIAKTIQFINTTASSIHGYIRPSTVLVSESGEWKLAGFDVLSSMKEGDPVIYKYAISLPDSNKYSPPEVKRQGWSGIKDNPITAVDAYQYGILIYESFNASYLSSDQLPHPKNIPAAMHTSYKCLINAIPKSRSSTSEFLEQGLRSGGYFDTPLIQLTDGIENLGIRDESERTQILDQLETLLDDFPDEFLKAKVLPELVKSVEFGGGGPKALSAIMKISKKATDEEYDQLITPVLLRLFKSQDRALRVCLLDNLPLMVDHLSQKNISNHIFPGMVTGFSDVFPVVREQTVKAVLIIVPKLSERVVNGELLRYLAKTANDEQPGIRTNTTICLGKMAKYLSVSSRAKVLTNAFAKALRDPFAHARHASLLALAATVDVYSDEDCATKILPGICPSLIDKEKLVREQADRTHDIFLQRIRKYASTLPDISQPIATSAPKVSTPSSGESSWTGWAISSFANTLSSVNGQMSGDNDPSSTLTFEKRSQSTPRVPALAKTPQPAPGLPQTLQTSKPLQPITSLPIKSQLDQPKSAQQVAPMSSYSIAHTPSLPVEADEFGSDWQDKSDAWDPDDDPFAPKKHEDNGELLDKNGEPDFSAWLSAQTKATKKTLPKGLTKSSRSKVAMKSTSTGTVISKRATPTAKLAVNSSAAKDSKVSTEEDDWGAEWK